MWGALVSESPVPVVPDISLRACGVLARWWPLLFPWPLCPVTARLTSAVLAPTGLASGSVLQVCPTLLPTVALCGPPRTHGNRVGLAFMGTRGFHA